MKRFNLFISILILLAAGAAHGAESIPTGNQAPVRFVAPDGTPVSPGDASNDALRVNCVTGCAGSPGSSDGAILDGVSSSIKATVKDLTNSNPLATVIVDSNGDQITSFGGGTQYNQGTAGTDTDTLTMAGCVRMDTPGPATGVADGDRARCIVDSTGKLWVNVGTVPVTGPLTDAQLRATPVPVSGTVTVTDGSGALNVIVDSSALPSGAATAANQDGIIKDGAGDTTQANVSSGRLHVDGSGVTQPVSGTVTANAGSGTFTVGGTVTANAGTGTFFDGVIRDGAGDTTQANVSTGRLHVDGSGVTQPVSGTVSISGSVTVTDGAGALNVICDSGCGGAASFEDNDAFVADTTPVNVMGALYDTTPPAITDGNAGAVRMNSARALLVDGSAVTQPVSGTVTVTDGAGALNVIVDSSALPSGASTLAEQQTQTTALQLIDDVVHATNGALGKVAAIGGQFDDTTPTAATENNVAPVRITENRAIHSNLRKADGTEVNYLSAVAHDAGAAAVDPLLTGCHASAAAPADVSADNDAVRQWCLRNGARAVQPTFAGVLQSTGNGVAGTGTPRVTIASDNTAFSVNVGTFPDNEPFNLNQIAGNAVSAGNGASGTGVQRVTIANDSTGVLASIGSITTSIVPGTGATNLGKAEDGLAGSGDVGIASLLVREDTPSSTAANGDYIHQKANQHGHTFVAAICNDPTLTTSVAIAQTALNGNAELVALTSGNVIYICGFSFMVSAAANVRLVYGTGSACATGETGITGAYPMLANQGIAVGSAGAILGKTAASNALCIETSAAANVAGIVTYAKFTP